MVDAFNTSNHIATPREVVDGNTAWRPKFNINFRKPTRPLSEEYNVYKELAYVAYVDCYYLHNAYINPAL